jgi:hypothetical protein
MVAKTLIIRYPKKIFEFDFQTRVEFGPLTIKWNH